MTDVLEKSYDDPISQNKYPLKIDISGNIGLSNIKLEGKTIYNFSYKLNNRFDNFSA